MVTNKNGITIDNRTFREFKHKKEFERYVEMRHAIEKYKTVVTPFDKTYIKELKREGYKLVDDFRIGG